MVREHLPLAHTGFVNAFVSVFLAVFMSVFISVFAVVSVLFLREQRFTVERSQEWDESSRAGCATQLMDNLGLCPTHPLPRIRFNITTIIIIFIFNSVSMIRRSPNLGSWQKSEKKSEEILIKMSRFVNKQLGSELSVGAEKVA